MALVIACGDERDVAGIDAAVATGMDAMVDAASDADTNDANSVDAGRSDAGVLLDAGPSLARTETKSEDVDCNGEPQRCTRTIYDRFGHETWSSTDDCQGGTRYCFARPHNEAGQPLGNGFDDDCDGDIDRACAVFAYDEQGRVTRYEGPEGLESMYVCGEAPPLCTDYVYDELGNRGQRDHGCDGTVDACEETRLDPATGITTTSYSFPCEAAPKNCVMTTHDAAGNVTSFNRDDDCDGTADSWCETRMWTLDNQRQSGGIDYGCDGTNNLGCFNIVYDDAGRKIRGESDYDCLGEPDFLSVYAYDDHGNEVSHRRRDRGAVCETTFTYDDQYRRVYESSICASGVSTCHFTTYSNDGEWRTRGQDHDCDRETNSGESDAGAQSGCAAQRFDAQGRQIAAFGDDDCDGTGDHDCEELVIE